MIDTAISAPYVKPASRGQNLRFYSACGSSPRSRSLVLPLVFSSGGSITSFSLIGIAIVFALSYNILLGQTGLLSFGHAVYYGLGGFLAIHMMNLIVAHKWPIPLPFIPLIGGFGGLAFAVVIGWVVTNAPAQYSR